MSAPVPTASTAQAGPRRDRTLRNGCFMLEALNGTATTCYGYYIFWFTERCFGFTRADNLLLGAFYGFTYMFSAAFAGRVAHRVGRFRMLQICFVGLTAVMLLGAAVPLVLGYSRASLWAECALMALWTIGASASWPTLQGLLSRESAGEHPRVVGIYNLIWAGASGLTFLCCGSLFKMNRIGTVFLLPAAIHVCQLLILPKLQRYDSSRENRTEAAAAAGASVPDEKARQWAKAFVRLAWVANPFAYVAMYGFVPIFPQLADKLHFNSAQAAVIFSVWQLSRVGAFYLFWRWTGWHYRFRLLLAAFVAVIGCFFTILMTENLPVLIVAQVLFGLAVGLIYYSSLYYTMDAGASESEHGGIHEAAIGFGIGAGPAVGFAALEIWPARPDAGTWSIVAALALGLVAFVAVRMRNPVKRG